MASFQTVLDNPVPAWEKLISKTASDLKNFYKPAGSDSKNTEPEQHCEEAVCLRTYALG